MKKKHAKKKNKTFNTNTKIVLSAVILLVLLGGFLTLSDSTQPSAAASGETVTLYKSPTCGCCVGYTGYLEDLGYNVEVVIVKDDLIKRQYNIPYNMQSCHTAVFGDYFVEGHVPIEVVQQMLEEQPDIDGITIPGMPAGAPGMPGIKRDIWTVYALKDGVASEYTTS